MQDGDTITFRWSTKTVAALCAVISLAVGFITFAATQYAAVSVEKTVIHLRLDALEKGVPTAKDHQVLVDAINDQERRISKVEGQFATIEEQHATMIAQETEIQAALKTIREMLIAHDRAAAAKRGE